MSKKLKIEYKTEGVEIDAIEIDISSNMLYKFSQAKEICKKNSFIHNVSILDYDTQIKQFMDDEELTRDNAFYLRYEYVIYKVNAGGVIIYIEGKWDSSVYFEVELD